MQRSILIIDDDVAIRGTLSSVLSDENYKVELAKDGEEGLKRLQEAKFDVVLLDIWMPGRDGIEILGEIIKLIPDQLVIMMSGHGTIEAAVKSTRLGAYDFLEKPPSLEKLLLTLQNAIGVKDLKSENKALKKQVQRGKAILGNSPAILSIISLIDKVAKTSGSVLITGENGTGKELVAHQVHMRSPRQGKPFIEVNCAAIPEELIESELFGHEKGAFTGATQQKRGKFDLAHLGTLFLDEIGDMSLKTQAKVLRILQEQKFERVGGTQTLHVDARIVAATNKDLKAEIQRGTFREDLFYRLNVVPIQLPPLRDRIEDIEMLSDYFLREFSQIHSRVFRPIVAEAYQLLKTYPWPGNIRELKNLIERIIILTPESEEGTPITTRELSPYFSEVPEVASHSLDEHRSKSLRDARSSFEKDFILRTLRENDWNISKTAAILGIERSHLHKKMKAFGIEGSEA